MSTYRNPTEIINRDLGDIIINTVNKVTENHLKKQQNESDQRVKELAEARKEQQSINRAHQIYSEQIHADAVKSGAQSESFFKQVDFAINEKFRLEGLLDDAPDESRYENGEIVEYGKADLTRLIDAEKQKVRLSILAAQDIERWKAADGKRLDASSTNDPGGIFTGSDASEFSKKINPAFTKGCEKGKKDATNIPPKIRVQNSSFQLPAI